MVAEATSQPVGEGDLAFAAERQQFVQLWLARRHVDKLRLVAQSLAIFNVFLLIALPPLAHPKALTVSQIVSAVALATTLVAWRIVENKPNLAGNLIRGVLTAGLLLDLWFFRVILTLPKDEANLHLQLVIAAIFAEAQLSVQFYPGKGRELVIATTVFALLTPIAMNGIAAFYGVYIIFFVMMGFCVWIRLMFDARLEKEAEREFAMLSQVAPIRMVKEAGATGVDLKERFSAAAGFCVCIASDWRNYQALAERIAPSQLAMSLNEYYDLCYKVLLRRLPQGNFFADWIADELFVVLYALEGQDDGELVNSAVGIATDLLEARAEFARLHGAPKALDVGIAAGPALIGMMGPKLLRKATALGAVPGRSRRLQIAGKLMRQLHGESDRVILGHECLMRLNLPVEVKTVALDATHMVRDLDDRELYYIDGPKPPMESTAAAA